MMQVIAALIIGTFAIWAVLGVLGIWFRRGQNR